MQNYMKTIVSALKAWTKKEIKSKIKGSAADWNQNDPSADSYVKNRPFYEENDIVHKLDSKYLDIPENIATTDDVQEALDNKMDIINPSGAGSFSMNRKENEKIGDCSSAFGYDNIAAGQYSSAVGLGVITGHDVASVRGKYNIIDPTHRIQKTTEKFSSGEHFYYASDYEYDEIAGSYRLINADLGKLTSTDFVGLYLAKTKGWTNKIYYRESDYYLPLPGGAIVIELVKYTCYKLDSKYVDIVGNGTSDEARSNAHTLDWDGNAWYQGDVYVGSTSGIDKDEGSKKLATEEYVNTAIDMVDLPDTYTRQEIDTIMGSYITDIDALIGGDS